MIRRNFRCVVLVCFIIVGSTGASAMRPFKWFFDTKKNVEFGEGKFNNDFAAFKVSYYINNNIAYLLSHTMKNEYTDRLAAREDVKVGVKLKKTFYIGEIYSESLVGYVVKQGSESTAFFENHVRYTTRLFNIAYNKNYEGVLRDMVFYFTPYSEASVRYELDDSFLNLSGSLGVELKYSAFLFSLYGKYEINNIMSRKPLLTFGTSVAFRLEMSKFFKSLD